MIHHMLTQLTNTMITQIHCDTTILKNSGYSITADLMYNPKQEICVIDNFTIMY